MHENWRIWGIVEVNCDTNIVVRRAGGRRIVYGAGQAGLMRG